MSETKSSTRLWAEGEFGGAALGDKRRADRLVKLAAAVAENPGGTVTKVVEEAAEREGAYRFLENDEVEPVEIRRAAARAALGRTVGMPFVFVPEDGSSLTLTDLTGKKGLGRIGVKRTSAVGLEVMSAIAVAPDGTPLGLLAQTYWARSDAATKVHYRKRPFAKRETRYWLDVADFVEAERAQVPGSAVPWYQFDRGGDFKEALEWAQRQTSFVTVRAAKDRRLAGEEARYLWGELSTAPVLGSYTLEVERSKARKPRTAKLAVRTRAVTLLLRDRMTEKRTEATVQAVYVLEEGTTPKGEQPIEWMLLTNHSAKDLEDALLVVRGYVTRWRIEEFHRTWKTTCRVEDAQLRSAGAIERWASTLAVVAMRVQRLTYLARTQPDLPASVELADPEIDALVARNEIKRLWTGYMPTIKQAVLWIAKMGGYTGKSSGGPPGAQTLGRGLAKLAGNTEMLAHLRSIGAVKVP
jgi:hypothetical protein